MPKTSVVRLTLLVLTVSTGCTSASVQGPMAPGLIVLPDAQQVQRPRELDGCIEYVVNDPYPGSIAIDGLAERLRESGWTETAEWVVPGDTAGGTRMWSTYLDGRDEVRAWAGTWKNGSGDLVTYFLTYRTPPGTQAVRLRVKGLRVAAETVRRLRR